MPFCRTKKHYIAVHYEHGRLYFYDTQNTEGEKMEKAIDKKEAPAVEVEKKTKKTKKTKTEAVEAITERVMTEAEEAGITEEELVFAKEFISSHPWVFAKTMADIPHSYVVRWSHPDSDEDFCKLAQLTQDKGTKEKFFSKTYSYLYIGGHKYWTMGSPVHFNKRVAKANYSDTTYILNRANI